MACAPSLEDVDGELVVALAAANRVAGGGDALGVIGIEQAELGVGAGGLGLDPAQPVDDGSGHRMARDGEGADRLVGLAPPELLADLLRFVTHFKFSVRNWSSASGYMVRG